MTVNLSSTEGLIIRKLFPLASLPSAPLNALCANMVVQEIQDDFLFKKGDIDNELVYLISGTVSLQAQGLVIDTIDAKDECARFALAHQIPRKIDALAKGTVRYLRLDADVINNPPPLLYREDDSYLVVEESEDDTQDWITSLLKLPLFQGLAPANLQKILISLNDVQFKKGTTILEQGNIDDYYYLIKSGTCLLTHKPTPDAKDIKLAQIGKGNTLGEDALIFDSPRTETVTALTDVELLRLDKQKFISFIKEPSLKYVDFLQMQAILITGATTLDIRPQNEYRERHLNGSINIPFFSLKTRFKTLPLSNPVIIIGNNDKASEAAAFLLIKHKYEVLILQGSINEISVSSDNESIFFNSTNNLSSAPQESNWQEQVMYPEYDAESASVQSNHDLDTQLAALTSENRRLKEENTELHQKYNQIKADKDNTEKQCRILSKQVEKLTQVLNKFKVSKT
jgi:CRP-like cAMP-binding protein